MATRRYSLNRSEGHEKITEATGAATVTKKIELTVDLASSVKKIDVLLALDAFKRHIKKGIWPPA